MEGNCDAALMGVGSASRLGAGAGEGRLMKLQG